MSLYYPQGCATLIPTFTCDPCSAPEAGRVRDVVFIDKDYAFTDITDPTEWATAIANKKVIIVSNVTGAFDGGSPVEGVGYGSASTRLSGYDFSLTFRSPDIKDNCDFWNALKYARNFRIGFTTETQLWTSNNTVSILPKMPITDSLTDDVVYDVEVKWSDKDLPCGSDIPPGTFGTCFLLT